MCTVADVLRVKGDGVVSIGPDASVLEAARMMNLHRIGALVVLEQASHMPRSAEDHGVLGIVSERDILTQVVAAEADPVRTKVNRIMSSPVITCSPRTTLDELRYVMRERRVRHMPVLSNHGLCGVISLGDLNTAQNRTMEETIRYLETYMYHG